MHFRSPYIAGYPVVVGAGEHLYWLVPVYEVLACVCLHTTDDLAACALCGAREVKVVGLTFLVGEDIWVAEANVVEQQCLCAGCQCRGDKQQGECQSFHVNVMI